MPRPLVFAAFTCFMTLASAAGAQPAPDTDSPPPPVTDENAPPAADPLFETLCNLACQLRKLPIIPGGGGGINAGKETEMLGGTYEGLELGVTRPAAEDFRLPSSGIDLGQGSIVDVH